MKMLFLVLGIVAGSSCVFEEYDPTPTPEAETPTPPFFVGGCEAPDPVPLDELLVPWGLCIEPESLEVMPCP
jgi:hypothetical protein